MHSASFDVGAGDVQLVRSQPFGVLQNADHFDIVFEGIAKDVGDDGRIEFSQYREFFGDERADPDVLESDGVEHPGRGFTEPRGRGAFDRFFRKAFGNEAAEAVQVHEVGKFEAVAEGSTGCENRIPQAQRANFYAEVNGASGVHFG